MNELQIVNLEQAEIASWDFESMKEELVKALSVYKDMVYTDDSIKSAKDDKAELAKVKKLIEDRRKAYKAKCLAPYEAIEPQVKEIVGMIEDQRVLIDGVIKDYTERQKREKEEEVKKYYDQKALVLGDFAEPLYSKLLDPKWLNASTSKAQYKEGIQEAIAGAQSDLEAIRAMNSPFIDTLIEKYVETLSLDEVKAKQEELVKAVSKPGFNQNGASGTTDFSADQLAEKPAEKSAEPVKAVGAGAADVIMKVHASQYQMNLLCDFMKAIGVTYEIQ